MYHSTIIPEINIKTYLINNQRQDSINLQCDRNNDINYDFVGTYIIIIL